MTDLKLYAKIVQDFIVEDNGSKSLISGLPSGFCDFDHMTSGIQRASLITISGQTSVGKTAFSLNIASNIAFKCNAPVLYITLESTIEEIMNRLLSSLSHIDYLRLKLGHVGEEDKDRIKNILPLFEQSNFDISDDCSFYLDDIIESIKIFHNKNKPLGLVVIDYIQLIKVNTENQHPRSVQIGEITRCLKSLAMELNIPIIIVSQLNRDYVNRADHRPLFSDLLDSSSIENDSDMVIFIYRDEIYNESSPDKGIAEIIVAKQRSGPIGKIRLKFMPQYGLYENFKRST